MSNTIELANFTVSRLGAQQLGARRGIDLNQPLDDTQVQALRQAWTEHLVLRFRGQHALSLQGQIAFSRHFGRLDSRPKASMAMSRHYDELPAEITVISNVKVGWPTLGALGDAGSRLACRHDLQRPATQGCLPVC